MTSGGRRIGVVARREYGITVRRREFLLVTFGLPLLYLILGGALIAATVATAGAVARQQGARAVGFLDQSGLLDREALSETHDGVAARVYATVEAGQQAVRARQVRAFVVVPREFARTGSVTVYGPAASFLSSNSSRGLYTAPLRAALLRGKVEEATIRRVLQPVEATEWNLDRKTGQFARPDPLAIVSRFVIPYVFSLLLLVAILTSSSYLLHGVVEEKENRVIEVLLSSVTHEELLAGKLLGLGAAGLTQLAIWVGSGLLFALVTPRLAAIPPIVIAPGTVVVAVLMFLLGYALYAAAMAGVGSLGTSWRESQQMAGAAVMFAVVPLMLITVILELPDGGVARFLSLFPPTAPIGMMLRVAAGGGSPGEVALSVLLLALTTWGTIRLSARIFRLGLLMYGQRPTPGEVWRWLRHSV